MNVNLKKSLDRAIDLLGTPTDYENYISIKIKPVRGGCCCFHCWPKTWAILNEYISPCGPLEDEGDVLIDKNNEKFVLECHESGPEIIAYLGLGTASIALVTSIINLIITLAKANQNEHHRNPAKLKITRRWQIKGQAEEEEIMEIDFPLSDNTKKLKDNIRKAIEERKE
ncbi:hypothetical protein C5S29_12730 [ANME-1 cluster archaeon GoMg3.2]|nr:hypothetical protein [ANME-1 cluster archaeon GoMg3.2]